MAYMKIHCDYCGGTWEVYERDFTNEVNKYCPHCAKGIHPDLWEEVKKAFGSFIDTNCDLIKDSVGYHLPLFQVDFKADNLFKAYKGGKKK